MVVGERFSHYLTLKTLRIALRSGHPYLIYLGRPFVSAESDAGRIKARQRQEISLPTNTISAFATPTAARAADQPTNWRTTNIQLIPNNEAENTLQERHLCITLARTPHPVSKFIM